MKTKILATVARKEHLLCGWEKFSEVFLVSLWLSCTNTIPLQYRFLLFRVSLHRVLKSDLMDIMMYRQESVTMPSYEMTWYFTKIKSIWQTLHVRPDILLFSLCLILKCILNEPLLFQLDSFLLVCSICYSHFFTSKYRLSLIAMKILL